MLVKQSVFQIEYDFKSRSQLDLYEPFFLVDKAIKHIEKSNEKPRRLFFSSSFSFFAPDRKSEANINFTNFRNYSTSSPEYLSKNVLRNDPQKLTISRIGLRKSEINEDPTEKSSRDAVEEYYHRLISRDHGQSFPVELKPKC